jgi:hypothetical protein
MDPESWGRPGEKGNSLCGFFQNEHRYSGFFRQWHAYGKDYDFGIYY